MKHVLSQITIIFIAFTAFVCCYDEVLHVEIAADALDSFYAKNPLIALLLNYYKAELFSGAVLPDVDAVPSIADGAGVLHSADFLDSYISYLKTNCPAKSSFELLMLSQDCLRLYSYLFGISAHQTQDPAFHEQFLPLILANDAPTNNHFMAELLLDQYMILKRGTPLSTMKLFAPEIALTEILNSMKTTEARNLASTLTLNIRTLKGLLYAETNILPAVWPYFGCNGGQASSVQAVDAYTPATLSKLITPLSAGVTEFTSSPPGSNAGTIFSNSVAAMIEARRMMTVTENGAAFSGKCALNQVLAWTSANLMNANIPGSYTDNIKRTVAGWVDLERKLFS